MYGAMVFIVVIMYIVAAGTGVFAIKESYSKLTLISYAPVLLSTLLSVNFSLLNIQWGFEQGWKSHGSDDPMLWLIGHLMTTITVIHYHRIIYFINKRKFHYRK